MRRARFNLEEQVGGLVDHERYELRRPVAPAEPVAPQRDATARRPLSIRATRAGAAADRRVA